MALQKSIELPSGVVAEYWKINKINFNYVGDFLEINLAGYVSQQTRDDNKIPASIKSFSVEGQEYINNFSVFTDDPRTNAYNYIKNIPNGEFANSVDV